MGFTTDKRKYLVGLHGEDMVAGLEGKAADLEKDLTAAGVDFKAVAGEPEPEPTPAPDQTEVVKEAVKAIVESEGFQSLIKTVSGLSGKMTAIETAADIAVETAGKAEVKANQTIDEVIAGAFTARSAAYQASVDGPEVKEEEVAALGGPEAESTGFAPGTLEGMYGAAAPGMAAIPTG